MAQYFVKCLMNSGIILIFTFGFLLAQLDNLKKQA